MTNKTNADTSSLVIHTRRTFFLVLLVCVLAIVVSLYQGGGRIRSAFEQSLTAISMLDYWDTTIKGTEQYLSLSSVIANSAQSPPSNVDAYQLEFTPIENKHMPKVNCIFPFDKTWRFYIGDDCCSARQLGADRRGKALIFMDSEGSNEDAEQHYSHDQSELGGSPALESKSLQIWLSFTEPATIAVEGYLDPVVV